MEYFYKKELSFKYFSVAESLQILERLGDLAAAHVDVAGAYIRAGNFDAAEPHLKTALDRGYPLSGIIFNYVACIAAHRGDLEAVEAHLEHAATESGLPYIIENLNRFREFVATKKPETGGELRLTAHNNFPTAFGKLTQPYKPVDIDLL